MLPSAVASATSAEGEAMETYFSSLERHLTGYDGEALAQTVGLFSQIDSQMKPAPGFIKRNELANMDRMARQV